MATLAELLVKIRSDSQDVEKDLTKIEKKWTKFGDNLQNVGTRLTTGITLPLAAIGGGAFKASVDFESAFAGVRKTVDATEEQLGTLRQGIRDMSKEIPIAATDIAGIAEAAGQLGIKTENILSFTRVMADLGVATNLSGQEAATSLARLANITQMPQTEFDKLGSTIVALGNNLATTEAEIVEMGLRIAGAGSQIGLTESQIFGFAGALSSVGINAEAGGSAISRVMIGIANEVASGGEKLQMFAQVAGMSASEFQTAFKEDAAGALITFIEGLGDMSAAGENVFGVLDDLGLSEIRVRDALLRASGAGDLFRQSLELGSEAWKENTALTNEATQRYGTTESQLTILWNKLKDVAVTFGDALVPAMMKALDAAKPLLNAITDMATWFANLDPGIQQNIITIAALVAALGPVLFVVGTVVKGISGLIGVAKLLAGAFTFLLSPVGLVVAAIAAVIAIGYLLYANWDTISAWLTSTWESIKVLATNVWTSIGDFFVNLWNSVTSFFAETWTGIRDGAVNAWTTIADWFSEWWGTILLGIFTGGLGLLVLLIVGNWDKIWAFTVEAWDSLMAFLGQVLDGLVWLFTDGLVALGQAVWDGMKKVGEFFVNAGKAVVDFFIWYWTELPVLAWEGLKALFAWVVQFGTDTKDAFVKGWNAVIDWLVGLPSRMYDAGKGIIKGLIKGFTSISIPVPSFGIDWKEGPMGINIPSLNVGVNWKSLSDFVPFLEDGGIAMAPTLAMIGDGADEEAVIPLNARKLAAAGLGGDGRQIIINWSSLARPSDSEVRLVAQLINAELGRT